MTYSKGRPREPISPAPARPVRRPVMLQGWHNLTSIHWRYPPEEVQRLLPDGYVVDTFDGAAWVGLIPFQMSRIRVPRLPPLGPLSTFPETNIRTYIVGPDGRRAVWFSSLDITRLLPVVVARIGYQLPYCWARMSIDNEGRDVAYRSERRWPGQTRGARSQIRVRIGEEIRPDQVTPLEHFLTARWALGTTFGRRLMWAEVDHPPWPLHRADLLECDETLVEAAGLSAPTSTPYVLYSPGVEVRIGLPSPLPRRREGTLVQPVGTA